jgi:hypothetical protein
MKHLMKVALALMLATTVSGSAIAAKCEPVPPQDVEGHIELIPILRQSMTANYFEENDCEWGGADQLNGLDAVILDIEGMSGPAKIKAVVHNLSLTPMEAVFLHANCARMGNPVVFGPTVETAQEEFKIKIPKGAKWVLVQGSTEPPAGSASGDIDVTLQTDGKECKRKKKKRRPKAAGLPEPTVAVRDWGILQTPSRQLKGA